MSEIKLSIIIPVYNVELYLQKCLDSLVASIYTNKGIEVLLIDDGSTDESYTICKRYENKYSFIKLIKQKNLGQSVARNNAITKAKGMWISFIDSDDIVINNFIPILFNIINNTDDIDMVMFKYKIFKDNISKDEQRKKQFNIDKLKKIDKNEAMYLLTAPKYWGNYLWNKIYRKEILLGNLLPEGKKYEDIGTLYKYIFTSKQVYIYDDILYFYRQREGSTVHISNENIDRDELEAREKQLVFFKSNYYYNAYERAQYYFVNSCISKIARYPNTNKLYQFCLKYLRSNTFKLKEIGTKTWIKLKIIKFSPKLWKNLKKLKKYITIRDNI